MIRNEYRERWARWLPSALEALAHEPPDFPAVMPTFPLPEIDRSAFALPKRELRVALLTSSGAYDTRSQAQFSAQSIIGDASQRTFDIDAPTDKLEFAHEHFDRTHARSDLECVLPRTSLREIGITTTQHVVSWSGYLLDWPTFIEATIPQMLARLRADNANAALIVPI
ncbi:MAG: hypothetical protein ACP5O6_00920 [Candidatus Baltobacteraceae bacterium]